MFSLFILLYTTIKYLLLLYNVQRNLTISVNLSAAFIHISYNLNMKVFTTKQSKVVLKLHSHLPRLKLKLFRCFLHAFCIYSKLCMSEIWKQDARITKSYHYFWVKQSWFFFLSWLNFFFFASLSFAILLFFGTFLNPWKIYY